MIRTPPAMISPHRHRYVLRVYYEDTDAGGVVYHANYLRFAERARTEAMRALGVPHADLVTEFGLMFMVRRVELDYLSPARIDESLVILTETRQVGGASAVLRQSIRLADGPDGAGRALVEIGIGLACVRIPDGRPARIPPRWRAAFGALVADGRQE